MRIDEITQIDDLTMENDPLLSMWEDGFSDSRPVGNQLGYEVSVYDDYLGHSVYLSKGNIPVARVLLNKSHDIDGWEVSHLYVDPNFRNEGLATILYSWLLENHYTIISDSDQTVSAHHLWKRLSRFYPVRLYRDGEVGDVVDPVVALSHPDYRLIILSHEADTRQAA